MFLASLHPIKAKTNSTRVERRFSIKVLISFIELEEFLKED